MATGINIPFSKLPIFGVATPFQEISLADQTTSASAQTLLATAKWIAAFISVKTYVVGTATVGPIFKLRASTVVGMTTPLIGTIYTFDNVASTTETQCQWLYLMVPGSTNLGFCDINVTLNGTATISYDAVIECVQ